MNKLYSIAFFLTSLVVISSSAKLGLPVNYTWPLKTKNICFAAQFNLKLSVEYLQNDGQNRTVEIPLDNSTFESFTAACSAPDNVHQLIISMLNGLTSIIFNFVVDDKNTTSLKKIFGYLYVDGNQSYITNYAPSIAGTHKFWSGEESLFESARDNSYRCFARTDVKDIMSNGTLSIKAIEIDNLQVQPFIDDSKEFTKYDTEVVCKADIDKDSNLIPIIVGACLAVLVVIVLVAYLVGRRRSRNGYQSV